MKRCSSPHWYVVAGFFAALLVVSFVRGPAAAPARYLSTVLLPGISLLFLLFGEGMGIAEACLLGPALSPLVVTLAAIPCIHGGYGLESIPPLMSVVGVALLVVGLFVRGGSGKRGPIAPRAWVVVLALASLVALPLIVNSALRVRSDAWFHAAVAESVARSGLPPDDPYYAGLQLRYFWAFHVYLLTLRATGLGSLFDHMAAINIIFFPIYLGAIFALSSRISASRSGPFWSVLLAVFGINAIGFLILLGRVAFGETSGLPLVRAILDGGTHYVLTNLALGYVGSISFFLDKFLVGSPFAMCLALFLIAVRFICRWLATGCRRELLCAGLFAGSTILFHTIVGLSLLLCGGAALAVVAARSARAREGAIVRRALAGLGMLCATAAILAPYLRAILPHGSPSAGLFTVNGSFLWTVLAAGLVPIILLTVRCIRRLAMGAEESFILAICGCALLLGAFARMPLGNINKIVYIAFLPLLVLAGDGVPALAAALRGAPRFVRVAAILIAGCGVATTAFGLAGSLRERGSEVPVPMEEGRINPDPSECDAYRWIREQTSPDAVFINDARLDLPVMAPRRQLWSPGSYAAAWGYPEEEIGWRREITERAYRGSAPSRELRNRLLAMNSPVYIVMRTADERRIEGGASVFDVLGVREVFRNEELRIGEFERMISNGHEEQPVR